jgi:cold shock CspA family protein
LGELCPDGTRHLSGDQPGNAELHAGCGRGFGPPLSHGSKDAFVHASTLEQSGLSALKEGERVRVKLAQGQKGREVRSTSILA